MDAEATTFRARVTAVHKNRWVIEPGDQAIVSNRLDEDPVVGNGPATPPAASASAARAR